MTTKISSSSKSFSKLGKRELNRSGESETTFSEMSSLYSTVALTCRVLTKDVEPLLSSMLDETLCRGEEVEEFEMRAGMFSDFFV